LIKEFFENLKNVELSDKYGYASITKLALWFSGSSAKPIKKKLLMQGMRIVAPRESAIVSYIKGRGAMVGSRLEEVDEKSLRRGWVSSLEVALLCKP
jgi:hypothetical protein